MYGFFSAIPGVGAGNVTITNCWANGIVTSCSSVIIDINALPAGSGGTHSKPIVTSPGGVERITGCVVNTATGGDRALLTFRCNLSVCEVVSASKPLVVAFGVKLRFD
jgi:hypothetical protein